MQIEDLNSGKLGDEGCRSHSYTHQVRAVHCFMQSIKAIEPFHEGCLDF